MLEGWKQFGCRERKRKNTLNEGNSMTKDTKTTVREDWARGPQHYMLANAGHNSRIAQ